MNDLLYLFGPLGCVAMVAIAAVLITRAGRRSPPPADPEVAVLRHEVPGYGRSGGRRRMAKTKRRPPSTRKRLQPAPSRGQRNPWWPVPGEMAVAAGLRGDSADVWVSGDGGSRRGRP